ncbi:putative replication protein [uncultured virus]|uniref:Putative replication protein n=1 Tax=uncultured virus TaxID=340016 RepID=A0A1I9XGE5_9VIRU|nr:putative replication protein [uncultured virus]
MGHHSSSSMPSMRRRRTGVHMSRASSSCALCAGSSGSRSGSQEHTSRSGRAVPRTQETIAIQTPSSTSSSRREAISMVLLPGTMNSENSRPKTSRASAQTSPRTGTRSLLEQVTW